MLNDFSDGMLEEMAAVHLAKMRKLMENYALIHAEGVGRGLAPFLDPDIKLLSSDERGAVCTEIKALTNEELVDSVHRYKDMPSCLKLTLNEIKRRLFK
jgi:hypothetical protein